MANVKRFVIPASLALAIKIFSLDSSLVERYYSTGIYPYIASFQRILFGWIPFSIGDIFYAVIIIWLIKQMIRLVKIIKNKQADKKYFIRVASRLVMAMLVVYISFNFYGD